MWCGNEVPGMILLCDLKEAMRLDRTKDMSMHISNCLHQLRFQRISTSCVEVVVLIRQVYFYVSSQNCVIGF